MVSTGTAKVKKRVLLVDDERAILKVLSIKLRISGYDVVTASSGKEALDVISSACPDEMLLDVVMPGMDGFEVLSNLRQAEGTMHMPVILLTNLGQRSDIEKGLKLGATDYIIKANYTPAQVVAKVKEHLRIK